jgi:hypothetical protein
MNRLGLNLELPLLLAIALSVTKAHGDDGVVRLRTVQGPILVTIFTAAEILQGRPAEMNILLQERDSNDPILDADVNLTFSPPGVSTVGSNDVMCGGMSMSELETNSEPFSVAAFRGSSRNKLFYSAPVNLNSTGDWRMELSIKHEGADVKLACQLPVAPAPHELVGLIPYLCLPPLAVGLFALNHRLRTRLRGMAPSLSPR